MVEITILSGKGGTGKTTLTAALAHLAQGQVICDLDVDAPDLHLLLHPEHLREEKFISGHEAVVEPELCQGCGVCQEVCRFKAVVLEGGLARIDPLACEGCKVCVSLCPEGAIAFPERDCGRWYLSRTRFGPLVHAQLFPGQENSGLLVSVLRRQARELASEKGLELILSDGPPGIGCPVISSLTGTDLAVLVTEPTPSGRHDLERILDLSDHFKVPAGVIINKADLNPDQAESIREMARARGLPVLAELPHDLAMTEAMIRGMAITEYRSGPLAGLIGQAWEEIRSLVGFHEIDFAIKAKNWL